MWKCHKCGKPVYFAERKQSLGYDWHPECLRCEECGKRLNPGQHAEHKGVPYCHVPCYGALFGPQLFGHGTQVESHNSFGTHRERLNCVNNDPAIPRTLIENKLKAYNQFYDGKSAEIRSREVNGRLVLEGALRIHWGVHGVIHLKENDDQRTVTIRKRYSMPYQDDSSDSDNNSDLSFQNSFVFTETNKSNSSASSLAPVVVDNSSIMPAVNNSSDAIVPFVTSNSATLPSKLDAVNFEKDELDCLLQVERVVDDGSKLYQTMPTRLLSLEKNLGNENCTSPDLVLPKKDEEDKESQPPVIDNGLAHSSSASAILQKTRDKEEDSTLKAPLRGAPTLKRRPGGRLSRSKVKRRCSINGHFYNRETSFFTPPHGSQMSVWVTSLVNTQEVVNLLLEKYKVDSDANSFSLFVIRDNGEQRRLKDDEYPLLARILVGPHEDVVRLFLMDSQSTPEVSNEVAQFLNFSLAEMRAILSQYYSQEEREVNRVQEKFCTLKKRIRQRMDDLKVKL